MHGALRDAKGPHRSQNCKGSISRLVIHENCMLHSKLARQPTRATVRLYRSCEARFDDAKSKLAGAE